jgi:hypothetical protein
MDLQKLFSKMDELKAGTRESFTLKATGEEFILLAQLFGSHSRYDARWRDEDERGYYSARVKLRRQISPGVQYA